MVGEDDVPHRLRAPSREALDLVDQPAEPVVAERDLALQPAASVRSIDRIACVGVELADVVQQRSGDGDVAVDPGNVAEIAPTAWPTLKECSSKPWR